MLAGQDLSMLDAVFVALAGLSVVLLELALLAVLIMVISRLVRLAESKLAKKSAAPAAPPSQGDAPLPDTVSQGSVTLIDTDEPTAAVIMAIVSESSGIALNRLDFKSIKRMGD